jgi:hypothetical protein
VIPPHTFTSDVDKDDQCELCDNFLQCDHDYHDSQFALFNLRNEYYFTRMVSVTVFISELKRPYLQAKNVPIVHGADHLRHSCEQNRYSAISFSKIRACG